MRGKKRQSSSERKRKIAESISKLRENESYRNNERQQQKCAKQQNRSDEKFRSEEQEQNTLARKKRRLDSVFRSQERERDRQAKAQRHLNEDDKIEERERNRVIKSKKRLDEGFRAPERNKDAHAKSDVRLNEAFRSQERIKDRDAKSERRLDETFRAPERTRDRDATSQRRLDETFRAQERTRDRNATSEWRLDETLRAQERTKDRVATSERRLDETFRAEERTKDRVATSERRLDETFRAEERTKDRDATSERRLDETFRAQERTKDRVATSERRLDETFRAQERTKDRVATSERRLVETFRAQERTKDRNATSEWRLDETLRTQERTKDRVATSERRLDETFRAQERTRDRNATSQRRLDETFREQERTKDRVATSERRLDETFREPEKERDRVVKSRKRLHEPFREEERSRDSDAKKQRRLDDEIRISEQERDRNARQQVRTTPRRVDERNRDRQHRAISRENPVRRRLEYDAYNLRRNEIGWNQLLEEFQHEIRKSPIHPCTSCGCIFYMDNIKTISQDQLQKKGIPIQLMETVACVHENTPQYCRTCKNHILNNKVPPLCLSNGLKFPIVPPCLQELTALEERLVALRLVFMHIKAVGPEQQLKLKGNIVNIENDLDVCAKAIPRRFDETGTVQLRFKRRMADDRHVWFEVIRPAFVERAKQFLLEQELYLENNVESRNDFLGYDDDSTIEFVIPASKINDDINETHDPHMNVPLGEDETFENDSGAASHNVDVDETLIYTNLGSNFVDIAPGEGKTPKPLYEDPFAEEMAHPKIYCGQKRKIKKGVKLTYTDIAKSECLREDRRCATPVKVLYMFKKSFNEKMRSAIQIYLRKRRGTNKITASQALDKEFLKTLVNHDEGYSVWKNLRSSPSYWANKSKHVLSMIRQLGKCTFFITFSAAETRWTELQVTLRKLLHNETISEEEAAVLPHHEKAQMIRSDPITCMRHFDHRTRKAHTLLMKKENGVFSPYKLADEFRRLEHQLRGSGHFHGIYWIEGAPEYDANDLASIARCVEFIDMFISVEKCQEGPMEEFIKYQTHKHSSTCKYKEGKCDCRFGYPLPPLPETLILEPLPKDTKRSNRKHHQNVYKIIQTDLTARTKINDTNMEFYDYLKILDLTKEDYILAIRSKLKRTTVFHKRDVNAAFINRYNKKLLEAWGANMDIQFVTNTYACAKYCVGYILKSDGGISKLMKAASREANANPEIREKLKPFAKVLLNGTEISSQEAAGFLLGIPNTHSSRQVIFINTGPPDERTGILKSTKELQSLDNDSEDICEKGLLDRYIVRPEIMEPICLAEFASNYEFEKSNSNKNSIEQPPEENFDEHLEERVNRKMPRHPLLDNSGAMRQRTIRKVIRFRSYNIKIDPRNYWREQLMLFIPWRNEELELLTVDPIEFGKLYMPEIIENSRPFYNNRNIGDHELQAFADEAGEEDEGPDQGHNDAQWETDEEFLADAMINPASTSSRAKTSTVETFLPPNMLPNEDYLHLMRSLNEKQRRVVFDVLHRLKTSREQFCIFLSGGAGVGKSHTITSLVQSFIRYCNTIPGTDISQPPVIVMAFTGKAAFNVLGMTIHHTLRLLPNQRKYERLPDLEASTLNTLRKKLGGLKLLIIDEISMVSVRMLYDIDQRLRQITGVDSPFGGVAMCVVGHMRQLAPIAAPYVFAVPSHIPNGGIVGNYLWNNNFKFYELTEIMRQRGEERFCKALNNMSEGVMDEDDVTLIKSREISESLFPPQEAVWLFKTNAECSVHNNIVHQTLGTEGTLSTATDNIQGAGTDQAKASLLESAKQWAASECDGLRYETFLKVGAEYFISTNINVTDGLFNGATGTLKAIEYSIPNEQHPTARPLRTWLDFKNPLIGALKRKSAALLVNRRAKLNSDYRNWVPIERIKKTLTKSYVYQGLQVVRTQMPLVACNGMTVAKAQGSTLPCVVVSTKGGGRRKLSRQELYVACSRATSINGLYIDGEFEPPIVPASDDLVSLELARIRSQPYNFHLRYFQDVSNDYHKFYFHNVQSLKLHLIDATSDACIKSADLLAFVEPHLLQNDNLDFPGYHVIHRTNCREIRRKRRLKLRNSEGAVFLLKDGTATTSAICFPHVQTNMAANGHCIFITITYGCLSIVVIYKSPMFPKSRFREMLRSSLSKVNSECLYVGDINLNLSDVKNADIINIFAESGLTAQLNTMTPSTNGDTHIDICFSDVPYLTCWFYESYYSYHKPICIAWPKF